MAEKTLLKEKVKKLLNSILCGYQKGTTLRQVLTDYDLLTGESLPLSDLGYRSLENFVHDIPDAVLTSWEGGEMVVRAVPNEKNMHIMDLVSRQKPARAKTKRGRRGGGGVYVSRRGGYAMRPNNYQCAAPRFRAQRPSVNPVPLSVPAFLRIRIRDLLRAFPKGLAHEDFQRAYLRYYGSEVDIRSLGYTSVVDLMQSMDDLVVVKLLASGFHIFLKVHTKSKDPAAKGRDLPPRFMPLASPADENELPRGEPNERGVERRWQDARGAVRKQWKQPIETQSQLSENATDANTVNPDDHSTDFRYAASEGSSISDDISDCDRSSIPIRTKKAIQKVLEQYPDGIWAAKFLQAYKEMHGRDLPYQKLGYHSVVVLMSALTDLVVLDRPGSGDWMLYDARKAIAEQKAANQRTDFDGGRKTRARQLRVDEREEFKDTLRQVLLANPVGVYLDDLEAVFLVCSGEQLDLSVLGHQSLEDLVTWDFLQDAITVEYKSQGRIVVRGIPSGVAVPDPTSRKPQAPHSFPLDVVGPGGAFTEQLPESDVTSYFMFVSNVTSPGQLWLQLYGEANSQALDTLMDELDFYRTAESREYDMPEAFVQQGQVCVAIFPDDGNWHRATLTGTSRQDLVEVYYVDYGGTSLVPRDTLKFIKTRFMQLPAQAMRGRLANLQPSGNEWEPASCARLLQLVTNKVLHTLVVHISAEHVLSVCLCDTSGSDDVHINDTLVAEGYAKVVHDDYSAAAAHDSTTRDVTEQNDRAGSDSGSTTGHSITSASEMTEEEYERNIKFIQLTEDYIVHMVKYEDDPYALSHEISAWLWEKDLLRSMLRQRRVEKTRVVLKYDDYPNIFEELKIYEVKGIMDGDEIKQHLTLYHFSTILEILDLFEHPIEELKLAVKKALDEFDKDEAYWKGEDDDDDDESTRDDVILGVQELEVALKQLDLQRKKTLQLLQKDPANSAKYVDNLDQIERRLVNVRARLKQAMNDSKINEQFTEEEQLIQECVDEQYKMWPGQVKPKPGAAHKEQIGTVVTSAGTVVTSARTVVTSTRTVQTNTVAPMPSPSQSKPTASLASSAASDVTPSGGLPAMMTSLSVGNGGSCLATGSQGSALAQQQQQALFQAQLMMTAQMMGYPQQSGYVTLDHSRQAMPFAVNQNMQPFNPALPSAVSSAVGQTVQDVTMAAGVNPLNVNQFGAPLSVPVMGMNAVAMNPSMNSVHPFATVVGQTPGVAQNMYTVAGNPPASFSASNPFNFPPPTFNIPATQSSMPSTLNPAAEPFTMPFAPTTSGFDRGGFAGLGRGSLYKGTGTNGEPGH